MTPTNASAALAQTVLDELVARGVREIVVCPGSRSAALAFAAYDEARSDRVRLHTRIDERTAGFLALGLARSSRRPVAVITTSGTAVANLHPAALEAAHLGVPLVLVTADRPARLRGTGANQTTDQVRIFGSATRDSVDVPPGVTGAREGEQVARWREVVATSLASATGRRPGPVQINLQFAEPMVPDVADGWSTGIGASHPDEPETSGTDDAPSPHLLDAATRTVVVAGDDAGPPARVLAERGGWPLLAEPSSGSRTGDNALRVYRLLLADSALSSDIERVVVAGHPTLSRPVVQLISRDDVEVVALEGSVGHTDPGHRATTVARRLAVDGAPAPGWLDRWRTRDTEVGAALDALLAASGELLPHHVAGAVARALPAYGLLHVGASNPIRDLDLMVPRYDVGAHRMVLANRGLSGIDGTLSSAIGAALARPHSSRSFALMGDVTFLHDANALVLGPDEPRPDLTVVVVNDDGGSIFASLEQGAEQHRASFERLFGTPHGVDLASLCAATRTPHWRVTSLPELEHALATPAGGIEVVEAVCRRENRRELDAAIRALA